jgi:manganese transport protein
MPSLPEVSGSIRVRGGTRWRRALAFMGPGYLVAVGYMDPGNWATSIAGGSRYGYALLTVALVSNIMALAELAICATDLAEVIGTAIGLNLLFGVPLEIGVLVTALDVFLILYLQNLGFRWVEAFVIALLAVIAVCFGIQIALADPQWGLVIRGFAPTTEIITNPDMLYLALGILGATVMPHNLYLHSGIVQTRAYGDTLPEKREALRFATLDSTLALMFALTINASLLILAAAAFHHTGRTEIAELGEAHTLLQPLLGSAIAPTLFGLSLLCCGLNSTVTATMAGQIVMEGFINFRLAPWLRRLVTRGIAIVPAAAVTIAYGEGGTAKLLIFSQVILSLQLPFAVIPLVTLTASKAKMGAMVAPRWLTVVAGIIAAVIVALNVKLLVDFALG